MSKKDTTPKTLDQELDEVKKMNEGFVDPDETPEPPKKDDPPKDPTPPVNPPADPLKDPQPPKKEGEEDPKPTPPAPPKDPVPPVVPPEPPKKVERPPTYIPMAKYHSDKESWKNEKEKLEARITELETIEQTTKKDSPDEDTEINSYAEKWGMEPDAVRDLLKMARKGQAIPEDKLKAIDAAAEITRKAQETEYFNSEWNQVEPFFKSQFPNATPEQIAQAKALMDQISHTPQYGTTPEHGAYALDYILFKEKSQFEAILNPKKDEDTPPADPPGKKTIEGGKPPGSGGPTKLTAADFKEDKDFAQLDSLQPEEKDKIVSSFDPLTFDRFVKFETYKDEGIEVNRGGRKIVLK